MTMLQAPFDPALVPMQLRDTPQWVGWKYRERDGRPTKVPVAISGGPASATDPSTWSSFDEALERLQNDDSLAGIGFVFSEDDPFAGIDLDDCLDDQGKLVPEALEIVQSINSYTEVSPSERGVKIFLRGSKPEGTGCRTKKVDGFGEIEVYDHARFFCVTGRHQPGTPETVESRQEPFAELCNRFWPRRKAESQSRPSPFEGDDDALIELACGAKNGQAFRSLFIDGDVSPYGGDDSAADLALCSHLAFWTGGDEMWIDRLFRRSALRREKWEREDYRARTIAKAVESCTEFYSPGSSARRNGAAGGRQAGKGRQRIIIRPDEHRVVDESAAALAADPDLYHRGTLLVRVLQEGGRRSRTPRLVIDRLPRPTLRERLTKQIEFLRIDDGEFVAAHPPPWLVAAVEARGRWPGIRELNGVSSAPVLRPDGSILQSEGYDEVTGVLYAPSGKFPIITDGVDIDDAQAALEVLLEVVIDFPFEGEEHRSAWVAGQLTPLARHAFDGPGPLFLVDANVRGSGKTLLLKAIGRIATGEDTPMSSYSSDREEMRKAITSIVLSGDPIIVLDNLQGVLGSDALDRALTATRWKDRLLGGNLLADMPLLTTWFATGNNVVVGGDTIRRVIHIRLDAMDEHPETRSGFRHPNLLRWVARERPRLVVAALTILAAYCRAGRPDQKLEPFGSYEGWSDLIRSALVWVGLPDPCLTRVQLAAAADTTGEGLAQLIAAWAKYDSENRGLRLSNLISELYPRDAPGLQQGDEAHKAMRAAIEDLVDFKGGSAPTSKALGRKLGTLRRRVVDGMYLDKDPAAPKREAAVWKLFKVETAGA